MGRGRRKDTSTEDLTGPQVNSDPEGGGVKLEVRDGKGAILCVNLSADKAQRVGLELLAAAQTSAEGDD